MRARFGVEAVVRRQIEGPVALVARPLHFVPVGPPAFQMWRARARLASMPVDVEVVLQKDGAELTVRPARPPLLTWSARHEKKYFELAHGLADQLQERLVSKAVLAPREANKAMTAPGARRRVDVAQTAASGR